MPVGFKRRFKWLDARLFRADLAADLRTDNTSLQTALNLAGAWQPAQIPSRW